MFYVSNISGKLVPFDPLNTPIASLAPGPSNSPSTSFASELTARSTESAQTVERIAPLVSENEAIPSAPIPSEDAAAYEGTVTVALADAGGLRDSLNVGRAGALLAYRMQESEYAGESSHSSAVAPIASPQGGKSLDHDENDQPNRVNPVRRSRSRYKPVARERKQVVCAADIMTSPVVTLAENATLEDAQRLFRERHFRHIPIVSAAQSLVGIVSDRDFIGALPPVPTIRIRERMVTNILTARPEAEIRAVAEVMIEHRLGCIPITDEMGSLVGILTRSDILRAIVNHAPIELWT